MNDKALEEFARLAEQKLAEIFATVVDGSEGRAYASALSEVHAFDPALAQKVLNAVTALIYASSKQVAVTFHKMGQQYERDQRQRRPASPRRPHAPPRLQ